MNGNNKMNSLKQKNIYLVTVYDDNYDWEFTVAASSTKEARHIGVLAAEEEGLVKRDHIRRTDVQERSTIYTL
jgi:hypothetical protein